MVLAGHLITVIFCKNTKLFAKFAVQTKETETMDNNQKQLSLDLSKEMARGEYSNLALITHSHSEFILDFAAMLPGFPKPEVVSRILMTPEHAKRLLNALQDNVIKYESSFGIIETDATPKSNTINFGDFGPIQGPKS